MRKIIVGAQVSMDGVMQAPGGPTEDPTKGFKFGGWVMPYFDQEFGEESTASSRRNSTSCSAARPTRFSPGIGLLRRRRSPWRHREAHGLCRTSWTLASVRCGVQRAAIGLSRTTRLRLFSFAGLTRVVVSLSEQ